MSNLLMQLANYLVASDHWPRIILLGLGGGLTVIGFIAWVSAVRNKGGVEVAPERSYRREHEVRLKDIGSLPADKTENES